MDYEKKYKEALERVRRLHDRMLVLSSTDALVASAELEFIFPELSESEDERIRKWLLELVENQEPKMFTEVKKMDVFAWLEKQKEQKPEGVYVDCSEHPEWYGMPPKEQKYAWSEEDEEMMKRIIERIEAEIQYGDALTMAYGNKEIAWLKSLRPSWKPSEEQMEELKKVAYGGTVKFYPSILQSLYDDLLKLKLKGE